MNKALSRLGMAAIVALGAVALGVVLHPVAAAAAGSPSRLDFDGDGLDDLVAGAHLVAPQGAPAGLPNGGGLVVDYSTRSTVDFLTNASTPGDIRFAGATAAGNFNGDGYADLATGGDGSISVLFGSPTGLRTTGVQAVTGSGTFGSALAAGDLNNDGYDDLAVGAKGDQLGAGAVTILFGSAGGVVTTGAVVLSQDTPGVPETAEADDWFGAAVAIGDVTGDGYGDLAVGAPGDDILWPQQEDGSVTLFPGSPSGPVVATATFVAGGRDTQAGVLGEQLAIADLNGDRRGDVIVPSPRSQQGIVVYLPGTAAGITPAGHRLITAAGLGWPTDTLAYGFAHTVASGDVTGDGLADLLIGDVAHTVAGASQAGAVFLVPGTRSGPTGAGARLFTQATGYRPYRGSTPDARKPETFDHFGYAITVLNLDGAGPLDVVIGTRYESTGSSTLPSGLLTRLVTQPVKPIRGTSRPTGPGTLTIGPSWVGQGNGFDVYDLGRSLLRA
ncbi:VCBS repeat-containing protein [Actinomycetes bacterium KLBMP 9797]